MATESTSTETIVEDLGNGYYLTTTVTITELTSVSRASGTKTASKTYTLNNNSGTKLGQFKLTGNFQYTGSRSTCLASSYETNNYSSSGKFTNADYSYAGNTAIGEFTYKIYVRDINTKTIEEIKTISAT